MPPEYEPAAFEQAFEDALSAAAPGLAFEVECDEFPCIAAITQRRLTHDERDVLRGRLLDELYPDAEKQILRHNSGGPGGHAQVEAVALFPKESDTPELRDAIRRRFDRRRHDAKQSVADEPG